MHGREGEERKRTRHMWTVPTRATAVVTVDGGGSPSSSSSSTVNFFRKDGRKISVGDCALFKPPQDSPPFIGIIRCLSTAEENKIKLGVNWLYRPAEVKLGKGILSDSVPNEVFYSFHKDEIPAASLLHPCKVAFLPKEIKLPSGISSFVCRRVYDITNKCLWWLTDQDFINERQEEVDQLLYKTRLDMHVTVQQGGCSPKPINGPIQTSQLKPGSDSLQNSASSFSSQAKGKKRERVDQGSDSVKRERTSKHDDGDSGHSRPEVSLKSEIAKIAENGGLEDSEAVEKLVQLMLPDINEKKIDLVRRSMLANVIAATDKFDCLNHFVHLKGLPVFDQWLQEVHRGKVNDGSGSKENEKAIEDFLIMLLRALDKLPVNLNALRMCNIGKSVNHLRTHKNLEIQKKARSLVDTWKKRVEAEMDAKSGSNQTVPWPSRMRLSEVSHSGSKHSVSSEVVDKSSFTQLSAPKTGPIKLLQGETPVRSVVSPGSVKVVASPVSPGTNLKDGQSQNPPVASSGAADPQTTARDEKSSSSSQSHTSSQSCSSDQAKTAGFSGKEDARSSAVGPATVNKVSGGSSRYRKSINGFSGPSGTPRETGSNKGSSHRNTTAEKFSESAMTNEKVVDVAMVEGSNDKLIVKIPNRRSPAQSASGGSLEDQLVMNSRASSPAPAVKYEHSERNFKERNDVYRTIVVSEVNNESWQSNDFKDVLPGSNEGDGSPACAGDEHCRIGEDTRRTPEISKSASSSSGNDFKSGKPEDAPFSSINVLIDSCVKYSEANVHVPVGDEAGMNLLASVAADEMSKSEMGRPVESPQRNVTVVECSSIGHDASLKSSCGDDLARDRCQSLEVANCEHQRQSARLGNLWTKNGDCSDFSPQEKLTRDANGNSSSSTFVLTDSGDLSLENGRKENLIATNVCASSTAGKASDSSDDREHTGKDAGGGLDVNSGLDFKLQGGASLSHGSKSVDQCVKTEAEVVRGSLSAPSLDPGMEKNKSINEVPDRSLQIHQKSPSNEGDKDAMTTGSDDAKLSPSCNAMKLDNDKERASWGHSICSEKQKPDSETAGVVKGEHLEENFEVSLVHGEQGGLSPSKVSSTVSEGAQPTRSKGSKLTGAEAEEAEEHASTSTEAPSSVTGVSDMDAKVEFDLNEGFNADEVKYMESSNLSAHGQLNSPLPFPFSSVPSSLPASITVTSAAKKPFVPPDDLLRAKGALGWKGSAATSAFRPAEPRRSLDTPPAISNVSLPDASAAKEGKPPLDIDLNVPDERVLEDISSRGFAQEGSSKLEASTNSDSTYGLMGCSPGRSSGGLDLDLNRVDEPADLGNQVARSNGHRLDISLQSVRSPSGAILRGEAGARRDFDLNNGPVVDEVTTEPFLFSQHSKNSSMPSKAPMSTMRVNGSEIPNLSSWFPSGYSAVTIPAFLPDRVEQPFPIVATAGPQRVLGQATGVTYNPDVYRAPVLSSSPAVPFPSGPFQYPVFPFGATSFPLPSTSFSSGSAYIDSTSNGRLCFPAVHSQLLGPGGAIASSYPRPPYVVSIPDTGNSSGADGSRKWVRQGLDLNSGPGGADTEARDEMSRQLPVASSQVLAEESARIYPFVGSILKRKEPDGSWDGFKQSSWQ